MGAATVALVYLSASDRVNRKIACLSAAFMVMAPMTGYFTAVILTETLFSFLLMLAIFYWGRGRSVIAGIAFGLATLTRPTMLPFLLMLPAISLLPGCRAAWRRHLMILLVALAVSSIWLVRNAVTFGRFIPIAASGWGINLLCGTMETEILGIKVWTGSEWALLDINRHPLLQVDPGLNETERIEFYSKEPSRGLRSAPFTGL
jgi:4-amino-4-deoxy-L-arabinose transferase-like glycosyltransferase